jgi:methionyl-tRNA synthetase
MAAAPSPDAPSALPAPSEPLYVTTPIYYVNAVPHLGTFYSTVVADACARFHRARFGKDNTFFLTGLDEHGQKIERMARAAGLEPKAYCDRIAAEFQRTWERVGISHDRFIRTTDPDHERAVLEMWRRMRENGDIYAADYDGWYCVGCEDWKTDDELVEEGGERLCPIHRRPVERVKEKNYFFRLSKYADRLLALYEDPGFFIKPDSRRNEVAEFVRRGLRDISVSRTSVKWGIPVPDDPGHVIYVWIDALTNYLTALGGPGAIASGRAESLWKQSRHLIAKDILRFHAVYWPAMLMSADLPPPRGIYCHGYITVKGQKISKTIPATRVDPNQIADVFGPDPLRYFVLREYSFGSDGDFTYEALFQRYESDLGNDLGNLLNRTLAMALKYLGAELRPLERPAPTVEGAPIPQSIAQVTANWQAFAPSRALEETWRLIRAANGYIDRSAPWNMAKLSDTAGVMEVICNSLELIRIAALLVAPAMPAAAREILRQLGRQDDEGTWPTAEWKGWPGGTLTEPQPVFPRLDPEVRDQHIARFAGQIADASAGPATAAAPTAAAVAGPTDPVVPPPELDFDAFKAVDLRAARVTTCERVPKTEKLLKLTLDLGTESRTVVSGIAGAYAPETLVGRTVLYLANLKPAKIRGVVSQGMILAAGDADVLALAAFDRDVPPGTKVR